MIMIMISAHVQQLVGTKVNGEPEPFPRAPAGRGGADPNARAPLLRG